MIRPLPQPAVATAAMLVLAACQFSFADTRSGSDFFIADFTDPDVSTNFCPGAIMELYDNSATEAHAYCTFDEGSMSLYARYSRIASKAIISGGGQSPTLVPVGNTGSVVKAYANAFSRTRTPN